MPFAIPLHRRLRIREREARIKNIEPPARAAKLPGIELLQCFVHRQNGVDWTLQNARYVAYDVGHRHEIFVVNALIDVRALDRY